MSIIVTVNQTDHVIPETNDVDWGVNVTQWIQDISNDTLQLNGGSFELTADVDFGSSFGIESLYYKSGSANEASVGVVRLANSDDIAWRNNADNGDLLLSVNGSDQLTFDGSTFATLTGTQTLTNTTLGGFLANRALVTNGSGELTESSITSTELGYLDGLTTNIQTFFDTHTHDTSDIVSGTFLNARISAASVTQHEAALTITESQIVDLQNYALVGHTHPTSDIVSGTFADARIAQSNVTQHEGALTLSASQTTSGTFADARISQTSVTQHEAALTIDYNQMVGTIPEAQITQHEDALTIDLPQLSQGGATDNQVLAWDNTTGEWEPRDQSGGGGGGTLDISNDGSTVVSSADDLNFAGLLEAASDGDGSATVSLAVTGSDTDVVTGTAGTNGNITEWNVDGDLVDSGIASADVVTPDSTDTLTNKTFDANGTGNSLSNVEVADFASSALSGLDATVVTGTAGTNGNLIEWNTDGDAVDSGIASADVFDSTVNQPAFTDISDVEISSPSDGQFLGYNKSTDDWTNKSITNLIQWFDGEQLGSNTNIVVDSVPSITALSRTDIAVYAHDSALGSDELTTYRFDGTGWSQVGNAQSVPHALSSTPITAVNQTRIAAITRSDELTMYRFDGTDWSQVGNRLTLENTNATTGAMAAINGTDVAFINQNSDQLRTFRFDGTNWSQVGNGLSFGTAVFSQSIAALSETDVALIFNNSAIRTYRFDGTNWSQVGSELIHGYGYSQPSITALNQTDIVVVDDGVDEMHVYKFNGSSWTQSGGNLIDVPNVNGTPDITALTGSDIAYVDNDNDQLRTYRLQFAFGPPPSPPLR